MVLFQRCIEIYQGQSATYQGPAIHPPWGSEGGVGRANARAPEARTSCSATLADAESTARVVLGAFPRPLIECDRDVDACVDRSARCRQAARRDGLGAADISALAALEDMANSDGGE